MNALEREIVAILKRHMPEILAGSVRRRAQVAIRVEDGRLEAGDLVRLTTELRAGLRLFARPVEHDAICAAIAALGPTTAPVSSERVELVVEQDVSRARVVARRIATAIGGNSFAAQRAATAASELSRNVVSYAPPGFIELTPADGPPVGLLLVAVDRGGGIARLDQVLAGTYRSKTGLGKGLAGVKRLASRFDVTTGIDGTRVEALIALA